jgi:hypothetical protein
LLHWKREHPVYMCFEASISVHKNRSQM